MARKNVPKIAPHARDPLDVFGLILLCAGLLGVMDGLLAQRVAIGILGVLFLAAFFFWQRLARYPIVPQALLASPQLAKTYALEIVIGVLEGSLFFIPTVLVATQGLSYAAAGMVAALGGFMFVAVIPASGRAIDRLGSRDVLLAGTVLTELGLAVFALGFPIALADLARNGRRRMRIRRAARRSDALHRHQRDRPIARARPRSAFSASASSSAKSSAVRSPASLSAYRRASSSATATPISPSARPLSSR